LLSVANAYLARDVRVDWQSAETDNLLDSLRLAATSGEPLYDWKATWPITSLRRVRFRIRASRPSECDFDDVDFYSGEDLVYPNPRWSLLVWPNSWEAPLALDGNRPLAGARGSRFVRVCTSRSVSTAPREFPPPLSIRTRRR
jgi:hypothetical protein